MNWVWQGTVDQWGEEVPEFKVDSWKPKDLVIIARAPRVQLKLVLELDQCPLVGFEK